MREALAGAGLSPAVGSPSRAPSARHEHGDLRCAWLGGDPRRSSASGGLLNQPHQHQVLIDLTTSHPAATRELAALAKATGREYVDCGMTGGAKAADAGTLTLMVRRRSGRRRCVPPHARDFRQ